MMEKFLDYLIKGLETKNFLIPIVIVIVTIIFKAKDIMEFFDLIKSREQKLLEELLKISETKLLSEETKEIIKERIDTIAFKKATGIYAEAPLREHIFKFYQSMKNEVSLYQIKMAMPYIKIKDNNLAIELNFWNKIEFWIINIGASILFFFSLLILLGGTFLQQKSLYNAIFSILLYLVFVTFAILLFKSSLPYRYAKRLQELIKKYNSNNSLQQTGETAGR